MSKKGWQKKGSTKLQRSKEFVAVIPKKLVFYWLVTHKRVLLVHYFKQRRCQLNIYYVGTYATVGQDQFSNFRGGYHLSTQAVTILIN